MRTRLVILSMLALVFVVAMASFMFTYTVRFTEAAVLTRFGDADDDLSTKDPGIHWKWPAPIEEVTKYDTRLHLVQTRGETQQTADEKTLIIEAFCLWRVKDPYTFFTRYGNAGSRAEDHYEQARSELRSRLRGALTLSGRYALDELFSREESRLPSLESDMLGRLRGEAANTPGSEGSSEALNELGIEVVDVGIERVLLANSITEKVIERMQANRNRLAKEYDSRASAQTESIRANAESQAETILAFVEEWANAIRAQGDRAAAGALAQMTERPDLAVYLKNLDMIRNAFSRQTTLVFSTGMPGMSLLAPDALRDLQPGDVPSEKMTELMESRSPQPTDLARGEGGASEGDSGSEAAGEDEDEGSGSAGTGGGGGNGERPNE